MLARVTTLITQPAAQALLVVDETDQATLSEIARLVERPVSTVQRTVDALLEAGTFQRVSPRGPVTFHPDVPRSALRRLAEWRLGPAASTRILRRVRQERGGELFRAPASVHDPEIRDAWDGAIRSIVTRFDPERIVLFGSQARGDASRESDVDLLVVFDAVADRRERRVELRQLLGREPFGKDILVASTDDLDHPPIGSALAEAIREGVTVYAR